MGKKGWKHAGCRHYSGFMVLSYWFRFVFSCICWCWVRYMYEMIGFMTVYTKKWRVYGILDEYSCRARACKRNKKRSMGYMMRWNAFERWSIWSKDKYIFFFEGYFCSNLLATICLILTRTLYILGFISKSYYLFGELHGLIVHKIPAYHQA